MSATQTVENEAQVVHHGVEDFEIEDSARAPMRRGITGKIIETMDKLKVGQSFPVTGESKTGSAAIQQYYKSANGYTFKRKVKDSDGNETGETESVPVEPTNPERSDRKFTCKSDGAERFRIWRTK